jgi:hypothetical protein
MVLSHLLLLLLLRRHELLHVCTCFIIIADEVAAGRPARGPYPGLHTYRGIFESTRDEKRDRSDPTLEGLGRRDAAGIRQIERQLLGRSQDPTL